MRVDLSPVCACDAVETEHELVGYNLVRRPVWECLSCGETRVGPRVSASDVSQPVATDGGSE